MSVSPLDARARGSGCVELSIGRDVANQAIPAHTLAIFGLDPVDRPTWIGVSGSEQRAKTVVH